MRGREHSLQQLIELALVYGNVLRHASIEQMDGLALIFAALCVIIGLLGIIEYRLGQILKRMK
jgi:hypothetical protein